MNFPVANPLQASAAVTVVVPAYNHGRYVVEALDSVRNQTFQDWVMIVIDDGSTDDTRAVLEDYQKRVADPRIQVYSQANAGSHATLNRGLDMADTPYLAILNSDDSYAPDRLEKLMKIAVRTGDDSFVVTGVSLIDENSLPIPADHWWQGMYRGLLARWASCQQMKIENPAVQTLLWGNFAISTSNFFMSRSVWARVGRFRNLRYVPDWDYLLRVAAELPAAFVYTPDEELLNYRLHGQNTILGGSLRNHAEAVKVLRTFQRRWVATGHQLAPHAIDRLHYLTRFIRHEHARQMLERQKTGWVEQVDAVHGELDRVRLQASQWQTDSQSWHEQARQLALQSEQWQAESVTWHARADTLQLESDQWHARADTLQLESAQWHARADTLQFESAQWQAQSEHWQQQNGHMQSQLAYWQAESGNWQEQVRHLRATLSWRLTAPLRNSKQILRKIVGRFRRLAGRVAVRVQTANLDGATPYDKWLEEESVAIGRLKAGFEKSMEGLLKTPLISIIMPVHNTPPDLLRAALASVQGQWYENWELCICNDASAQPATRKLLAEFEKADARIKCVHRAESGHIVLASNDAIAISKGEFLVFLDHDDQLAEHALFMFVQQLNQSPDADLIYSDEDKLDEQGRRCLPFFKPDWSPVLQWSQNYVGHLMCLRRSIVTQLGGFLPGTHGSQDHDLVLRMAAQGAKIVHLPHVLYHWRIHAASTSANPDAKPYAHQAGKQAVARHLGLRYGEQFDRVDDSDYAFVYLPRFKVPAGTLVSIIIPTRDKTELLRACIDSIRKQTSHAHYEIIVLDNGSQEAQTKDYFASLAPDPDVRVIAADIPFNWSRLNNIGRDHAKGQVLVFLNNDTLIISADWLQRLTEYALLPDVATVGPLLLYPDDSIQHAGVVVGMGGWADHVFKGEALTHYPSPFISSQLPRNVLANTGACVAIASARFDQLGGFDEAFLICGSDVELGIRAHKQGYSNVYLPSVRLYHLEGKTRSAEVPEVDFQQSAAKYAPYREQGDPFYNLNLDPYRSTPTPGHPAGSSAGAM